MKQGGIHSSAKGFTIVETLIVLAVTGLLFLAAATLINGKQAKTQFQTAINEMPQQIRQVINEVSSGYFPNNGNFSCTADAFSTQLHNTAASQGTNGTCVSLGKAMQFAVGTNSSVVATYPIAGWRNATGNLDSAHPVLIAPSTTNPGWYDDSANTTLDGGLSVQAMYYYRPGSAVKYPIGGMAFMSNLGQLDVTGQLASGSQQLELVVPATSNTPNVHTALNQSKLSFADAFDTNFTNSFRGTAQLDSVNICFASGTTNQSGLVSISSNDLTVTLTIWNGSTCS